MVEKKINPNRFFWNPITKEKIYNEYMDGTKIELNAGQLEKAEEAKLACMRRSLKEIETNAIMARKPLEKRGISEELIQKIKSRKSSEKKE